MGDRVTTKVQKELATIHQKYTDLNVKSFLSSAMGDRVTTKVQKELAAIHQKYTDLNVKVDSNLAQIRSEMQTNSSQLRSEMQSRFKSPTSSTPADSKSQGSATCSYTKHSKIECPKFDASDFVGWHHHILQFFEADSTPENTRIRIVMMHLEGQALQWHMQVHEADGHCNLKPEFQLMTIMIVNYAHHVESLMNGSAPLSFATMSPALKTFLSPNTNSIQSTYTQRTNTKLPSLQTAFNQQGLLPYTPSKQSSPTEKASQISKNSYVPTRAERDERKKQGLCMWCAAKYTPGHKCGIKAQLYQMFMEETTDPSIDDSYVDCIEFIDDTGQTATDAETTPVISLHALLGCVGPQTMQIAGKIKNQIVITLVDSGSTHNFLYFSQKVGLFHSIY
ncbi:hypothetical protein COLO4_08297 [Corchorus olitorius]|uniref:Retrotransposon gag protein n=1 Tax=Corchorus olitorius TaxID=93759 RepID=A0A1R3KGD8_9ROSI|nr:hypothetical protein COLO4_08297 [Corchorus olitorius]